MREFLTLIVGASKGGAWVAGTCAGSPLDSTRPCWTLLEYQNEPDVFRSKADAEVARLIKEHMDSEKNPKAK